MASPPDIPKEACPVDPATRSAWLKSNPSTTTTFPVAASKASESGNGSSCDSSQIDQSPPPSKGFLSRFISSPTQTVPGESSKLTSERVISTIPRGPLIDTSDGATPANNERETGASSSGNWIYPSEKMFWEAMSRKGHKTDPENMRTIVPIHNAVNERAWKEIKDWEKPWISDERCGGPRLDSFLGLSTKLSPKARLNTLLGYTAPFDRHDWVVDRCGTKVEYVIDFYTGRDEGKGDGKLNIFLDVRPKLNSLEGWKMRAARAFGVV